MTPQAAPESQITCSSREYALVAGSGSGVVCWLVGARRTNGSNRRHWKEQLGQLGHKQRLPNLMLGDLPKLPQQPSNLSLTVLTGTGSYSKAFCRLSDHVVVSTPPKARRQLPLRLSPTMLECRSQMPATLSHRFEGGHGQLF